MRGNMEDGGHFGGAYFHSPLSDDSDSRLLPYVRLMGSLSPEGLLSPVTDSLVYERSEYGTSGAPSFSSSQDMTPGGYDGEQDAFLPLTDSSQSTSDKIRNLALRKLYSAGYVKAMGKGAAGEMVIRCVKCDETCLGKRAAMNHMFTFHPEVEPYDCQLCSSCFRAKNLLRLHYVTAHISKRMLCDICGKRFSDRHLFKSHRMVHEIEVHVCNVCDRHFGSYLGYKKHARSHKQRQKQKNTCGFCVKHFFADTTYWKHMEYHNNCQMLNCSRCNETFTDKGVLARHWSTHEDQLPCFLCTGCDWLYYTKKQRCKHWRTMKNLSEKSVKKLMQTFTQSKKLQ